MPQCRPPRCSASASCCSSQASRSTYTSFAARTLGASSFDVFRRVTLPLSVPGLAVGATLVFSLTASSFVTPALLGGNFAKMLGTLVEEQILTVFDWPFGAAIATLLTARVMIVNLASVWLIERRFPSRAAEGS